MSGIDMIANERQEQIEKHNRTVEKDAYLNKEGQLIDAMWLLIASFNEDNNIVVKTPPENWNSGTWEHILQKNLKDKLIIIGAFAAAEIDRLNYIKI